MAGTLSVVSTPIGHLDDITLRALNVLRAADLVAAEDTRRTAKLLAHFGISAKTTSFHEHNAREKTPLLIRELKAGKAVALVSDAGTPLLSDPGLELVGRCIADGITVDAVPGASAALSLAVVSGFPLAPWTIYGFPPHRGSDRKNWFADVCAVQHCVTFLESPHRILTCIQSIADLSGDRPIAIGRELTKVHQSVYRGTAAQVLESGLDVRGEFTVMLGPVIRPKSAAGSPSAELLAKEFGDLTEPSGTTGRRDAIKIMAKRYGLPAREVYAAVERMKRR